MYYNALNLFSGTLCSVGIGMHKLAFCSLYIILPWQSGITHNATGPPTVWLQIMYQYVNVCVCDVA